MFNKGDIVSLKEPDEMYHIGTDKKFEVAESGEAYTTVKIYNTQPQMFYRSRTERFKLWED